MASLKSILIGTYSFLITAHIVGAISSLVYLGGLQMGPFLVSLLIQGLLLTAVIKEWRLFLSIWRILIIIVIVIMSLIFVFEILLVSGILFNLILAYLIGRYTNDLKRAIIVACNF
uniref:Uncharacterized protein n=1 Tax=Tetranychus urticae TaxID=32264 RepID=T1JY06_TETUR